MTSDYLSVTTRGMLVLHRHMVHFAWPFDFQSQLGGPLRLGLKPICRAWVSAAVPQTWLHVHSCCHCCPPCLSAWSRVPSTPVDFHSGQFCGVPRLTFHWFCLLRLLLTQSFSIIIEICLSGIHWLWMLLPCLSQAHWTPQHLTSAIPVA